MSKCWTIERTPRRNLVYIYTNFNNRSQWPLYKTFTYIYTRMNFSDHQYWDQSKLNCPGQAQKKFLSCLDCKLPYQPFPWQHVQYFNKKSILGPNLCVQPWRAQKYVDHVTLILYYPIWTLFPWQQQKKNKKKKRNCHLLMHRYMCTVYLITS